MAKKNIAKEMMNKMKMGKVDKEKEQQVEEGKKIDPIQEIDPTSGFDFGLVDYGKCEFMRPCCKRLPNPCGCMAYFALAITLVGGMIGSIIIW